MFETLLFDIEQSQITVYIDEINIHQKIRLNDDDRVDTVLYFQESMTVIALLKKKNNSEEGKKSGE